jgi:hypothetical protein
MKINTYCMTMNTNIVAIYQAVFAVRKKPIKITRDGNKTNNIQYFLR